MSLQMILALIVMLVAVVILFVPHKYIDTSTCKRHWCAILTILAGAAFFTKMNTLGTYFVSILFLGIFINYAFPLLFNVLVALNRKSDP